MPTRWLLAVEYLGAAYNGWQRQNNGTSVQQVLEQAVSQVANQPVQLFAAGRTDKGVSASGQIVHFDSTAKRSAQNWLQGINCQLPWDIGISHVQQVAPDFHARFCAISRRYRYIIHNRAARSALLGQRATWYRYPLNLDLMQQGAQFLIGTHDFNAFRAAECQAKSPVRTIYSLNLARRGDFVTVDVHGDAFLQHMVRNIVGVLLEIGTARQLPIWAQQVLQSRDRQQGAATAPPWGLYLAHVEYPPQWQVHLPPQRLELNFV